VKKERKNHFATGLELDNLEEEKNAAHILLSVTPTERKNQSQLVITQSKPVNGLVKLSLLQRSHIVTGNQTLVVNKKNVVLGQLNVLERNVIILERSVNGLEKLLLRSLIMDVDGSLLERMQEDINVVNKRKLVLVKNAQLLKILIVNGQEKLL